MPTLGYFDIFSFCESVLGSECLMCEWVFMCVCMLAVFLSGHQR